MKHLVVPDVHERLDRLAQALEPERLKGIDKVTFLGDWFDTFDPFSESRMAAVCHFIMGAQHLGGILEDPEDGGSRLIPVEWLLGNHDCHYFFNHHFFPCSGYDQRKKNIINHLVAPESIARFRVFTKIGPYTVSHAGFAEATMHMCNELVCAKAIEVCQEGQFSYIFGAGKARGGSQPVGGPTWLDWNWEFEHVDDFPQIVGHTNDKMIRTKCGTCAPGPDAPFGHRKQSGCTCDSGTVKSWCLDTALRHVAIVDDVTGTVEIIDVAKKQIVD